MTVPPPPLYAVSISNFSLRYSWVYFCILGRSYPFVLGFTTNDNEGALSSAADMGDMTEAGLTPGGIIGFALGYTQASC